LTGTGHPPLRELIQAVVGLQRTQEPIDSRLLRSIKEFLKEKSNCQTNKAEIEEDADDEDHSLVLDSATDLIVYLAMAFGTSFLPQFDQLLPLLLKFARTGRIHSDRSMAIGCLADVLLHTGPYCVKYATTVLDLVPAGLVDADQGLRRNSAWCLGALIGSTGTALVPQFMQFLQMLQPLCTRASGNDGSDTGGADTDNALSVVAHMIRASPTTIPLRIVLPVMLKALPLLQDDMEGPNIYRCLVELLSSMHAVAVELAPAIMNAFAVELKSELITSTPEVKQYIVGALKGLAASSTHSELMNTAFEGMDQNMKAALIEAVTR
jgi:acyl carrier protein